MQTRVVPLCYLLSSHLTNFYDIAPFIYMNCVINTGTIKINK